MRLLAVFSEAWRNVASGASGAAWFALVLFLVGGGLGVADTLTASALISQANVYRASGGAITTLVAPGRIDGKKCAIFADVPGVTAAGALRSADDVQLLALPKSPLPVKEVTAGFPQLLVQGAGVIQSGVLIPKDLAASFNITGSGSDKISTIATNQGSATVAATYDYPSDGRRPGLGYALIIPTPSEVAFDECWVESWPQSTEIRTLIRSVLLPETSASSTEQPHVAQLNSRNGTSFDGHNRFEERITRFGSPVALVGGAVLGFLFIRIRRLELTAARHSGVTFSDQAIQVSTESVLTVLTAILLCFPVISYAIANSPGGYDLAVVSIGFRPILVASTSFIAAALISTAATKEKYLFQYFKNR